MLSSIIACCLNDRKTLLALTLTSKDCSHEATKLLWAFHMRISVPNLQRMTRLSSFIASNPDKALYVRHLHVNVPTTPHMGEPLVLPLQRLVRTRDEDEDWSAESLEAALETISIALSCMHNLVSLCIEADGFFHEIASALSVAARMGRFSFQLYCLETNLFVADGFAGFFQTQPNIEKLTQHWRRDRFLNEPGTLSAANLNTEANRNLNTNADTGAGADADGGVGVGGDISALNMLSPSSVETRLNTVPLMVPILPNLRHLEHAPRGMAEVTRDRPVDSIATTLREVRDVSDLVQALEASRATVTRLKVNVEAAEVLRPFLERLSLMRQGHTTLLTRPASFAPGETSDFVPGDGQGQQVGSGIEMLGITVQAHRDVSPLLLREQPTEQVHDLLSNFRHGFPRLHTLRWGGPLVPGAVRQPEMYAGPALRTVLTETMGVPGNTYVRVFDGDEGEHAVRGRWEKVNAPRLKMDGSRRREVFQRIGTHDIVDVDRRLQSLLASDLS